MPKLHPLTITNGDVFLAACTVISLVLWAVVVRLTLQRDDWSRRARLLHVVVLSLLGFNLYMVTARIMRRLAEADALSATHADL